MGTIRPSSEADMPRISPYVVRLATAERAELERRSRSYTSLYRDVIRARIVLYAAEGLRNDEIAARLDTPRQIVSKWRKRFFEKRLEGLEEEPRRGRPVVFSPRRRRRSQGPRLSAPLRVWPSPVQVEPLGVQAGSPPARHRGLGGPIDLMAMAGRRRHSALDTPELDLSTGS